MTGSQEHYNFGRHPKLWTISAANWVLENPDFRYEILLGRPIKEPAKEIDMTQELESIEAPDLEQAIAAAHQLLDRHAHDFGEFGLEIYVTAPQLPHADQARLGIRDYKLSAEARKQARAIGLRGRDLELRVARLVRHAVPFEHKIANLRFRGIVLRVEEDTVTWIGLLVPPRRRRTTTGRKATRKTR
jgi:hypothetical protein